jgi:hypothetical protein
VAGEFGRGRLRAVQDVTSQELVVGGWELGQPTVPADCCVLTANFQPLTPAFMDPAEQLQRLYLAGFEFQTFERFPNSVGVIRGECIVLMMPTPDGLQMIGAPGWRIGEVMGVLTEVGGRKVFQNKNQIVEATEEKLASLERFRADVKAALVPTA